MLAFEMSIYNVQYTRHEICNRNLRNIMSFFVLFYRSAVARVFDYSDDFCAYRRLHQQNGEKKLFPISGSARDERLCSKIAVKWLVLWELAMFSDRIRATIEPGPSVYRSLHAHMITL